MKTVEQSKSLVTVTLWLHFDVVSTAVQLLANMC